MHRTVLASMLRMTARRVVQLGLVMVILVCGGCGGGGSPVRDRAVTEAYQAYGQAKAAGINFDRGPCIAEELPGLSDWVVDIAHEPRQPVDGIPANQCRRYRRGQAHHFVELTPDGDLIRAQ
jgi:hypothetical protein